jgi:hypothetical protein
MDDTGVQIKFDAPAVLRKWPSVNNERVSASLGARPYLIIDGCVYRKLKLGRSDGEVRRGSGVNE